MRAWCTRSGRSTANEVLEDSTAERLGTSHAPLLAAAFSWPHSNRRKNFCDITTCASRVRRPIHFCALSYLALPWPWRSHHRTWFWHDCTTSSWTVPAKGSFTVVSSIASGRFANPKAIWGCTKDSGQITYDWRRIPRCCCCSTMRPKLFGISITDRAEFLRGGRWHSKELRIIVIMRHWK